MKKTIKFICFVLGIFLWTSLNANNINITNVSLTGATSSTIQVQYNMFWDNSWRDGENWDAAWVFIKYSTNNGSTWFHGTLSTSGHVSGTATPTPTVHVPQDNLGFFVYRSATSSGTYVIAGQELQWNFATDGLNQTQASSAEVRVFGIEMVYIPEAAFALGDGVNYTGTPTPSANAYRHFNTSRSVYISHIFSNDTILCPISNVQFRAYGLDGIDLNRDGIISTWPTDAPNFPIGFRAFYCMKYKVTQGQYCDFLNTLSYTQQTARVGNATNIVGQSAWNGATTVLPAHRNNIFVITAGVNSSVPRVYNATRPDRDCNFLNWPDGCAYADWAGLRPFTDMEREKMGRGILPAVQGEFANGTISRTSLTALTAGNENGQEIATNTSQNFYDIYPNTSRTGGDGTFNRGPIRAGIFAKSGTSRTQSGTSYWGVKDLLSSLNEWEVAFSSLSGRSYTGLHGNGSLNAAGFADVNFWPGINGNASLATANNVYAGTTGVTSGAGAVFIGMTVANATAGWGPWFGTSITPLYPTWTLSTRFPNNTTNMNLTSTDSSLGRRTSFTERYQQVGFRAVKSNL